MRAFKVAFYPYVATAHAQCSSKGPHNVPGTVEIRQTTQAGVCPMLQAQ